jgi:predicted transcriptional regulator
VIADQHLAMLTASGITAEHAAARGYETITDTARLTEINVVRPGRRTAGLLVPQLRADGSTWGYQYRPDEPRLRSGKPVKYETPWQQRNGLDVPPGVGAKLSDPTVPLFITEGVKKADCGALHGLCIVALSGVWNWLHTNTAGGKMALPEWRDVALNGRRVIVAFDGDVARQESVQKAMRGLAGYLATKEAKVEYLHLPDTDDKTGLDDYLAEHNVEDLWRLVKPVQPAVRTQPVDVTGEHRRAVQPKPTVAPVSLNEAHKVFRRWLGNDYDTDALDAMLTAAAVERFDDGSDLIWLLIISGPGNAKTETAQALDGINATITSIISSEAALLSATPKRDRSKDATGGLLRKIGDRGMLVIKDVTSILSMNRDLRARVLAALREVYDGSWYREVGTDGGHTIEWKGRIAVVGAVTTAWDTAHSVVATMGDRFVLVRMDSTKARPAAGRRAIGNTGDETRMRRELAAAVAGVIAGMNIEPITITDAETDVLIAAADLVTLARTGVEYDYRGDVIQAHAPEMPTRFAKQLTQIIRGAVAIGMDREAALRLALRCARDSMPPMRLEIIDDLAAHPHSPTQQVRKRIDKPRNTVDRQLQALHMLGVLTCDEEPYDENRSRWYYSLADGIEPRTINPKSFPEMSLTTPNLIEESEREESEREQSSYPDTDISGTVSTNGQCRDCGTEPRSPGRPRCNQCHRAWLITMDGYSR